MKEIIVKTTHKTYPIYLTNQYDGLVECLIKVKLENRKFFIISDANVAPHHLQKVKEVISKCALSVEEMVVAPGEVNKHLGTVQEIYKFLITHQCDRKSCLIALGGGVIGDMTGFVAATYMRGIQYVQLPTSLLAQVDSSIGGKTGVDLDGYKNIVGAFKQPEFVYMNYKSLDTLPIHEFENGMAEVFKHGLIRDKSYYEYLLDNREAIINKVPEVIEKMIERSCQIKRDVVEIDEFEMGLRAHLNFGHTVGHSIERLHHFEMLHGECITIGMCVALYLSMKRGSVTQVELDQFKVFAQFLHLPTISHGISAEVIYEELFYDKKTANNQLQFILLNQIGESVAVTDLSKESIIEAIRQFIE